LEALYSHAATVLQVLDIQRSLAFYSHDLGFDITFKWNDPVDYAVLKSGDISLHLAQSDQLDSLITDRISIYIFTHDIHLVYQELIKRGVVPANNLKLREYGMKDFDVRDPDGYRICYGQGV